LRNKSTINAINKTETFAEAKKGGESPIKVTHFMIEESQQKSRTSPNRRSGVYKIKSCDTIIAGKETLAYNLQLGGNTKPLSPLFLQLC